ncbi:Uncharacterised protein [Escherichia coli]|nr:Uncharacterised protein [Escherichia coli]
MSCFFRFIHPVQRSIFSITAFLLLLIIPLCLLFCILQILLALSLFQRIQLLLIVFHRGGRVRPRKSLRTLNFFLQRRNLRIKGIFPTNVHGRIPELPPPVRQCLKRTAQRIQVIINIRRTFTCFLCQCRHGYPGGVTGTPLLSEHTDLFKLGGCQKMQFIIQRLRSSDRIILQPFKLTDGVTDRLPYRAFHLCGSFRHHTNIVTVKCTAPHYLRQ